MDNKKAKLIFDKMAEIREIVKTEPNCEYFTSFFEGDFMAFNNDPAKKNCYCFSMDDGEIERVL